MVMGVFVLLWLLHETATKATIIYTVKRLKKELNNFKFFCVVIIDAFYKKV